MFGLFGNRKKYNGTVDTKLNNEYQINTQKEPFPGPLAFLKLLDAAWAANMNEDEAAMYVASLYFCGLLKAGHEQSAENLYDRIHHVGEFGLSKGMISRERYEGLFEAINKAIEEHLSRT